MKIHRIAAIKRATVVADEQLGDNMLRSWNDREHDIELPTHISECHEGRSVKGFWDYALNRGGKLAVDFDGEAACVLFCAAGRYHSSLIAVFFLCVLLPGRPRCYAEY